MRKTHIENMQNAENFKTGLFNHLTQARDEFVIKRDQDEQFIAMQKEKIDKLDNTFRYI